MEEIENIAEEEVTLANFQHPVYGYRRNRCLYVFQGKRSYGNRGVCHRYGF